MAFSSSFLPHFPLSSRRHYFKFCSLGIHERHNTLSFVTSTRCCALHDISSVLGDKKSSINSNGTPEPTRALLERLFAQTQKLEEHMNGNSHFFQDAKSNFNLENLESDLEAALEALRKKEEDLEEAKTLVMSEHAELKHLREELERREKEVAAACSKQENLEDGLWQANLKLVSQARHIEDLKLRLKERDPEIAAAESALLLKEDETNKLRCELARKNEEVIKTEAELIAKAQLLNEANDIVKKQDIELRELRNALHGKQLEIEDLLSTQQLEAEKVKAVEAKLEKQTMEWLLAQEELKKLGEAASKHAEESKETIEDFQRVKRLLVDVRSELVSSQKSLVTSRQKMEEQELMLEKQFIELEEQKETIMSYMKSLKSAQVEVENERAKLSVAEARNGELELDLSLKKDLLHDLQEELDKEKHSLHLSINEASSLREELSQKSSEFEETSNLLVIKEKELVEAKLEIQHLVSEQKSLQLILQERDLELNTAKKRLEEVNAEVAELKMLLKNKEDQLILATDMLKEKDNDAEEMQHELNDVRLKASEAETAIGRIVDLTEGLVNSMKEENHYTSDDLEMVPSQLLRTPAEDYTWQRKQMEAELELVKDNLMAKEKELLAAQRQLAIKEEELGMALQRLEEKDKELQESKEKKPSTIDSVGQESADDLAVEKHQLEAAQLEVEAVTSALSKLADMSRELLSKANLSIDADLDVNVFQHYGVSSNLCAVGGIDVPQNGSNVDSNAVEHNEFLTGIKSEVARLSALTDRLVQEAGGVSAAT